MGTAVALAIEPSFGQSEKLNVLVLLVDDLRPEIGAYGSKDVKTPNIDKLSQEGVHFERAYAQEALCGPSRASILTGRAPSDLNYYQHTTRTLERNVYRNALTLPAFFRSNGFHTVGTSKVTHFIVNNAALFNEYRKFPVHLGDDCGPSAVCSTETEEATTDFHAMTFARSKIQALQQRRRNWFMVVGFRRPHLSFRVPQDKLDAISADQISLPPVRERLIPQASPWQAYNPMCEDLSSSGEVLSSGFEEYRDQYLDDATSRRLRRGYFASVAWIDDLVGRVLEVVDMDNTIVVLTSDHGWQLGEHGSWCKGGTFELALRVPLLIRDPRGRRGVRESAIVEHTALFPTLAELAGLEMGAVHADDLGINVASSYASLVRPDQPESGPVRDALLHSHQPAGHAWSYPVDAAFAVWPICQSVPEQADETGNCRSCFDFGGNQIPCGQCPDDSSCVIRLRTIFFMGFSVRTDKFRYTEWRKWNVDSETADWSSAGFEGRQLFDHSTAAGRSEIANVAEERAYSSVAEQHQRMLFAKHVPCVASSASACEGRGQHCVFAGGACVSRSSCAFSTKATCEARGEACRWGGNKCENLNTGRRTIVPPTASPTLSPTTKSPTGYPTSKPKPPPPVDVCSENEATNWWRSRNARSKCISQLVANVPAASPAKTCPGLVPNEEPPQRVSDYRRWAKRRAKACHSTGGCQSVVAGRRCVFNECANRNDGSCTLAGSGGSCLWYDQRDNVRTADNKRTVGCNPNPCAAAESQEECARSSDKLATCTWCASSNSCQITKTYRSVAPSPCMPCSNSLACFEDQSCAEAKGLHRCKRIKYNRKSGAHMACGCQLVACPLANPWLADIAKCDVA